MVCMRCMKPFVALHGGRTRRVCASLMHNTVIMLPAVVSSLRGTASAACEDTPEHCLPVTHTLPVTQNQCAGTQTLTGGSSLVLTQVW